MDGLDIIVRTLSQGDNVTDKHKNQWQYHSRSDHHSKTACWAILFDLLQTCRIFTRHVADGVIGFGINHEIRDFTQDKKKNLDLVVCRPDSSRPSTGNELTFAGLVEHYKISLAADQRRRLLELPRFPQVPVGSVLVALEAKAAMTAHTRARPRLYDELNSSHSIVHGHDSISIAAGLVLVNAANSFVSPDLNKHPLHSQTPSVSKHRQPRDADGIVVTAKSLKRRANTAEVGFDAMGIVVIDCQNNGSRVQLVTTPPAPQPGDIYHYENCVHRICQLYQGRFPHI
jgi:hypothetical protein